MISKRLVLSLVALAVGVGGAYVAYNHFLNGPIKPYEASRDRAFILEIFKKNRYWLLTDYSPDYDVAQMLDKKTPLIKEDPLEGFGKLIIKTYVVDGQPAGFVAYYSKKLRIGQILFLAVDEKYRKKGYARVLMNYAMNDLKKQGMLVIRMNTRVDNTKARALYENLGFKQIWTDGAYMIYELVL